MPLHTYCSYLTPDPWLRIVVLSSGRLLFAAGLALVLTLDLDAAIRAIAALLWLALARFELARLQRGFAACAGIRMHADGRVEVRIGDEDWQPATLMNGSLVLRNLAWLSLKTQNGLRCVELLRGDARKSHNWRRLQVIWRHIGA